MLETDILTLMYRNTVMMVCNYDLDFSLWCGKWSWQLCGTFIYIVICFNRCIVTCVIVIVPPIPLNRLPMAQSWKRGVL